jgi:hypothetical protein
MESYKVDYKRFLRNSFTHIGKFNIIGKMQGKLIFEYHGLEKGMTNLNFRYGFGSKRVLLLINLLTLYSRKFNFEDSVYYASWTTLNSYFHKHNLHGYNNFEYNSSFIMFQSLPKPKIDYNREGGSTILNKSYIIENRGSSFENLVRIRKSVRDFSTNKVNSEQILKSIELANNSPSVCNRASWKTYIISDIITINSLLILQGGITGYANNISHLLLVVCNLNRFSGFQERSQPFIDGGLFSMSLMYSLTYFGVASCPLNVNLSLKTENSIRKILSIPDNEVLIMFIAAGSYNDINFVTNSPKESLFDKIKLVP